jgi:exopolysaccharide biosynthesis protein
LSNYEVLPYDIYGPSVTPDRTAVGYRADGKVILFICDGRISASDGATLVELAQIMKGLGCVGAVNFDGGGSTGMVVNGQHLNDQTGGNRAVVSTIGFFKK